MFRYVCMGWLEYSMPLPCQMNSAISWAIAVWFGPNSTALQTAVQIFQYQDPQRFDEIWNGTWYNLFKLEMNQSCPELLRDADGARAISIEFFENFFERRNLPQDQPRRRDASWLPWAPISTIGRFPHFKVPLYYTLLHLLATLRYFKCFYTKHGSYWMPLIEGAGLWGECLPSRPCPAILERTRRPGKCAALKITSNIITRLIKLN